MLGGFCFGFCLVAQDGASCVRKIFGLGLKGESGRVGNGLGDGFWVRNGAGGGLGWPKSSSTEMTLHPVLSRLALENHSFFVVASRP